MDKGISYHLLMSTGEARQRTIVLLQDKIHRINQAFPSIQTSYCQDIASLISFSFLTGKL